LRKNIAFAIILVAGLSGVGSAFIYWMIYIPLRKIISGTKAVAAGRLDEPIDIGNKKDEIGYLARSFNKMTERIRDMTGHLNRMNVELEHKIEERTLELKKTQESVMQSEKLASLGLMAAAIAHEINNPLTAVLTYSALLAKQAPDGSETKEDLEVIVSETTRCRSIVRGLLDFARETEFRQKSVNINQLLEETIALLKHQVMFQDIDIVKNMAAYLPDTIMDADQVKQVFINMMLNAADAMPNGGKLFVRTSSDYIQNEITIEFTDTGVGIPERDVKRIFDPFFTTKEKGRGTGLGLSVSYGIVQRHGGSIDVKSRVGQGTTFMITFPVDNTQ
jgi:two-component system NtrC family sensor kinase